MTRTQVYLPDDIHTKLHLTAKARKEPMAQVIRDYVQEGLQRDQGKLKGNAHLLLDLAGIVQKEGWEISGPHDLSINHNKYFAQATAKVLERIHKHYDHNR